MPQVADDDGGDALADLRQHLRLGHDDLVVVGVHIDESRRDDPAAGVEHDGAILREIGADLDDALARDAHVGIEARRAGAVDDRAAAEKQNGWIGTECGWHGELLRSEERADRAGDAITVIDREQDAPLVERRARMRDAAADQVADLRRVGFVGAASAGTRADRSWRRSSSLPTPVAAQHPSRDESASARSHLNVVRRVALAHRQDRERRLGAGLHARPHLERWLQALAHLPLAAAAGLDAGEQALVVAGSRA
jgi:hypothetical protein